MTNLLLLGAAPTWVTNWLTPVWLLSLGALLGLATLVVLWGVAWLLSRIPALGTLAEQPKARLIALPILTLLCYGSMLGLAWPSLNAEGVGADQDTVLVAVLVMIPAAILLGAALIWLPSRRTVAEVPQAISEGPLLPIFWLVVSLAAFAFLGGFLASKPREILDSVARLPYSGTRHQQARIPGTAADVLADDSRDPPQFPIDVRIRSSELYRLALTTDQTISVDTVQKAAVDVDPFVKASAGEAFDWQRALTSKPLFETDDVSMLYVRNYGVTDATVDLTIVSKPLHPEVSTVAITAAAVVALFLLYVLQRAALPKISAVSLATVKSEIAQPMFLIVMLLGLFALLMFIYIPYNTLGEDIKVLKVSGMELLRFLCVILAVWAASTSIADEIEGRTALTVLSKPLLRRSFILGKYLGIFWTIAIVFILLGTVMMVVVSYKSIYDATESSKEVPLWQVCHLEMMGIVPGLLLAFMEVAILAAISVAISTRLPMLANFVISFATYVLGHLTPLLVQSTVEGGAFEAVVFVAQLISTVFPVLDHFSIEAAVAAGVGVPFSYLGWALIYTLIYGAIALLLALVFFEDRDLA